jgi:hypothetical protein
MKTRRILIQAAVAILVMLVLATAVPAADDPNDLEGRVEKLEMKVAKDRIRFTGDMRITADSISATMAERFDGMALQKALVDTLFFAQQNGGAMPADAAERNTFIQDNYSDYLYYQDTLSFEQIKQQVGSFPPAMQQALIGGLLSEPQMYQPEQDYDNDLWYTTRLRLNMNADVKKNVSFTGRLTMYKTWGDSTGVQVFNGFSNSFSIDGTGSSVPNSDILRVERAYFDWRDIGGTHWYASAGRRPATSGPPIHIKDNELRAGTPNGHVIDFQFDGITIGYKFQNWLPGNAFRLCFGQGYESGFGNADQLKAPADRLDDVYLLGINWDLYNTDSMFIQTTIFGAWDITDGFNGLIVLPTDPVSGNPVPAPVVMRYTPSASLGDVYMADLMIERDEGPLVWFVSLAALESDPTSVTSPFGGLLSDPFEVPEKQDAWSVYAGLRFAAGEKDFFGFEYNHGSEYWFNFTQAADELVLSKLATRGDAYEGYWLHEFKEGLGRARMKFRLSALMYEYDYSGSGFQTGAPKELGTAMPPVLGFPTYEDVLDIRAAMTVKF